MDRAGLFCVREGAMSQIFSGNDVFLSAEIKTDKDYVSVRSSFGILGDDIQAHLA